MIQKIVWQMIQIWGGKRYKKDVANDTKYGVADDRMADETQPQDISVLVFLKAHTDVNLITFNGCSFYTSLTFVLIYLDGIPMEGKKANSSILLEKPWSTIGCQGSIAIVKGVPVVNVETLQIRKEWRVTCHSSKTKWARNMICCFLLTKFLLTWKNLIIDHDGHQ